MQQADAPIGCGGIQCTEQGLVEIEAGRVMVRVDRPDIRQVALRYGTVAPHPVLQVLFGLALAAIAILPLAHLVQWLRFGGTIFTGEVWLIPLPIAGVWMIAQSLRKGYFLEVDLPRGKKRLAFHGNVPLEQVQAFADEVERRLGVTVSRQARIAFEVRPVRATTGGADDPAKSE